MRQFRELSRFLLLFFMGILIGTIFANWMAGWLKGVPDFLPHYLEYRKALSSQAWEIRLLQITPQRLVIPLLLWMIGRNPNMKDGFVLATIAAGIWLSSEITWLTCLRGWRGIFVFLQLTLPQGLGYAPVWCVLAWGNPDNRQSFDNREKLFLSGLYLAGLLGEIVLNPLLTNFL